MNKELYDSSYWYNGPGDTSVFVVGAEHSGTRYLWGLLKCHKDIGYVGVLSYPGNGRWWKLTELKHFSSSSKVVIIFRDKTCLKSSQKREGTCGPEQLDETPYDNIYDAAYNRILDELKEYSEADVVCVSYEGLVQSHEFFRNRMFNDLELNPENWQPPDNGIVDGGWFTVNVKPVDGNVKYITGEKK